MLWTAPVEINDAFKLVYANDFADDDAQSEGYSVGSPVDEKELPDPKDLPDSEEVREAEGEEEISEKERQT